MGWVAVIAFGCAAFVVAAGLLRPAALEFAEPVLCPRDGQTLSPTDLSDLDILRRSADKDYALFCTSETSGVQDVTTRWMLLVLASTIAGGLALLVRARVTPPSLRAPAVPALH